MVREQAASLGDDEGHLGEAAASVVTMPETCQEIKNGTPGAADGAYTLYVGHSAEKPWQAYCKGMATTPVEYLSLPNTGASFNYSQYTVGGYVTGTNVKTSFTKIRINPSTLAVDVTDRTFATSTGIITDWGVTVADYASAGSCQGAPVGLANVDLRGTPFRVTPNEFVADGWGPTGSATYSSDDQVVNLTGGGSCGSMSTLPAEDGFELRLAYPGIPATCEELKSAYPIVLADGEYVLYSGHNINRPWTAYCKNMASSPVEYLSLPNTGGSFNYSQYTVGGYVTGTTVKTSFTKIRINPITLTANVTDRTFATSTGMINEWGLTAMDYANAGSCQDVPVGFANVDLRGTPFSVLPGEFITDGWGPTGGATHSSDNQVVNLAGGGACGSTSTHATADGFQLGLSLQAVGFLGDTGTISQGDKDACVIKPDRTVQCWGQNPDYALPASPSGTFTQIDSGEDGSCGIRTDGTIGCWGGYWHMYDSPPAGTYTQVVLGRRHGCALKTDGAVACWGFNLYGQASPPEGTFIGLSSSYDVTCGLRSNMTLACWGNNGTYNTYEVTTPPAGEYTQVTVGKWYACALKRSDSTVTCWGMEGHAKAPAGVAFKRIVAGTGPGNYYEFACGIRMDDTLFCWSGNGFPWIDVPQGTFKQIAGRFGTCGVRTDGTVACFGSVYVPDPLQPIPAGLVAKTQ